MTRENGRLVERTGSGQSVTVFGNQDQSHIVWLEGGVTFIGDTYVFLSFDSSGTKFYALIELERKLIIFSEGVVGLYENGYKYERIEDHVLEFPLPNLSVDLLNGFTYLSNGFTDQRNVLFDLKFSLYRQESFLKEEFYI